MRRILSLVLLVWIGGTVEAGTPSADGDDERVWDAVLDLHIIDGLLEIGLERHPDVEPPQEWMPLERFLRALPKTYQTRIPVTDPWHTPYSVRSLEHKVVVVSQGPDGLLDAFPPGLDGSPPRVPRTDAQVEGDDLVLIVGGEILNPPRSPAERLRRNMADLRSIGVAAEEYSIDNDLYPPQHDGLGPVELVEGLLSPLYIRALPIKDAWGNDFLYWSDGNGYIIVSPGADKTLDRAYGTDAASADHLEEFAGEFDDPSTDMVFANGNFVQWPRGVQR